FTRHFGSHAFSPAISWELRFITEKTNATKKRLEQLRLIGPSRCASRGISLFWASPSKGGQYMNNWKKANIVAVLVFLLGISLAACGTTQTGSSQPSLGNVTLYTADGLEAYYKQVIPMFEHQYNAKVNIVTDGSGAVVNRLLIEKDNPQADVVVTLPPFVQ